VSDLPKKAPPAARRQPASAGNGTSRGRRPGPKRREQDVIDAAAEIFRRRGYADTSVQDVADAVGILKGSLYYYIDSKEDLLFRVLLEVHEDARGVVEEVAAMDAPPLERLRTYVRKHVMYNTRNLTKIAVYYHDFELLSPERRKVIVEQRHVYERFVEGLIEEAQERGDVAAGVDTKLASFYLLGAMNWLYTWYRPGGPATPEQLADLYADLIVNGLVGAGRDAPPDGRPAGSRRARS
jgi:AcrR family transcriptional regulator